MQELLSPTMRRRPVRVATAIASASALLLFACAGARPETSSRVPTTESEESTPPSRPAPTAAVAAAPAPPSRPAHRGVRPASPPTSTRTGPPPPRSISQSPGSSRQPTAIPAGKRAPLLIYTANLTLAVFETTAAIDKVEKLAKARGGYLVRRTDTSITVRVPAQKFRAALDAVAAIGDVIHRQVTAQDVTAQFRDLRIRLKNYEAVRDRLQQLLARAKNVSQALQVERQLERVTGQIEHIKGQLKLMRELIAYSTINAYFQPKATERVASEVKLPFRWLGQLGLPRLLNLEAK